MAEGVVVDLAAVMGLEGTKTVALAVVVGVSAAHHFRQLLQTMKKNGIRTKSCFERPPQKSQYLKTMLILIILLYLQSS